MTIERHAADRAWAFEALDQLEAFLSDPDYEGSPAEESAALARKRLELRDNKYRVVILGAFNVGKSALINALLGDEYLPTVLEECTAKITHVCKGDAMRIVLGMLQEASDAELESLDGLLAKLGAPSSVSRTGDGRLAIEFSNADPKDLVRSLRPLVTMSADEDFPQLRTLRAKFDELFVYVRNDLLPEDVALVDSPGAHTLSETNRRITQDIIPDCHLVVSLVDGQSAGSEHDRAFLQTVARDRRRKIFFVINKSDQLNADEIDPFGHRGPARDLLRSLEGIVEAPELFFVSSLYGLVHHLLRTHRLTLADLDQNNKIKIPFGMYEQLMSAEDPRIALADYLMQQSRFEPFKNRLLEYLFKENREGAVLETVCRFIDNRAWTAARPLEVKLDMARNMPRFAELAAMRGRFYRAIDENRAKAIDVLNAYNAMSGGGNVAGRDYPGFESIVERLFTRETVESSILKPVREWYRNDANLKKARKQRYVPLAAELDARLDAFLATVRGELEKEICEAERTARDRLGPLAAAFPAGISGPIEAERAPLGRIRAGLAASRIVYAWLGAVLAAVPGAVLGYHVAPRIPAYPETAAAAGLAIGAGVGLIAGLALRAATAKRLIHRKLDKAIADWTDRLLFRGINQGGKPVAPVKDQIIEKVRTARNACAETLQRVIDQEIARLNQQVDALNAEEETLRREQAEIIARLEPKHAALVQIAARARAIVSKSAAVPIPPLKGD